MNSGTCVTNEVTNEYMQLHLFYGTQRISKCIRTQTCTLEDKTLSSKTDPVLLSSTD